MRARLVQVRVAAILERIHRKFPMLCRQSWTEGTRMVAHPGWSSLHSVLSFPHSNLLLQVPGAAWFVRPVLRLGQSL